MRNFYLLAVIAFAFPSTIACSGEFHLYNDEIFLKVTDFRVPKKNISARILVSEEQSRLQKFFVENGSRLYEINTSEYALLKRPQLNTLTIKGSRKNTNLIYLSLDFFSNEIPIDGVQGQECKVTFVLDQESLIYQVVYVQSENRMLIVFKAAGKEHYVSKYSEMKL